MEIKKHGKMKQKQKMLYLVVLTRIILRVFVKSCTVIPLNLGSLRSLENKLKETFLPNDERRGKLMN